MDFSNATQIAANTQIILRTYCFESLHVSKEVRAAYHLNFSRKHVYLLCWRGKYA